MIAFLPGHHSGALGAVVGSHSEHAEACILATMLATRLDAAIITGTLREKIAQIESLTPSLAVELHYGNCKFTSNSGHVIVSDNGRDEAARYCSSIIATVPNAKREPGLYRNGDVDFFIQRSPVPSLMITIDDFANLPSIIERRASLCSAITTAINGAG